jgi:acetate kinase
VVDDTGASQRVESLDTVPAGVAAAAHRIVHGGAHFRDPVVVNDEVERDLAALAELAPLHAAPAIDALSQARRRLPDVPHVAVFDTAFHATIPDEASTYAVPRRWREEWGIRRYGFHGLSVQWSSEQVPVPRLVVCHLGGGCSVTAVLDGHSIDTTMGFTPLEGVPMATRSGSIDPGALLYLLRRGLLSVEELERALEHESGLAALSGYDVYAYRIALAVGAMAAALDGIDALVFTGGVGEHVPEVREKVCARLGHLGAFRVEIVAAREDVVAARAARALLAG